MLNILFLKEVLRFIYLFDDSQSALEVYGWKKSFEKSLRSKK